LDPSLLSVGANPALYQNNNGVFEPRPLAEREAFEAEEALKAAKSTIAAERYERECTSLLFDGYYFKMYPSDRNLMFQAFFTLALYAAVQTQVESAFVWEEAQITALEE
jgi:hypothetical protein